MTERVAVSSESWLSVLYHAALPCPPLCPQKAKAAGRTSPAAAGAAGDAAFALLPRPQLAPAGAGPRKEREGLPRNSRRLCQPRTGSWPHTSPVSRVAIVLLLAKASAVLGPKTALPKGPVEAALDASGLMYSTERYTGLPENHIPRTHLLSKL